MKKALLIWLPIIALSLPDLQGQVFLTAGDELVNGYSSRISGTDYEYHSCIPGLRQSIIIRADSGKDSMVWETAAPHLKANRKYAAFIWVAAIGSSPGNAGMLLGTDQGHSFSFRTDGKVSW